MNDNIYSPPAANLDLDPAALEALGQKKFYVVAPLKYFVLYFFTLGAYEYYWFYKNWSLFKARTNENIWPVMRAIFPVFFAHALFERVDSYLHNEGAEYSWTPSTTATTFVILQIAGNVLNRLSIKTDNTWIDVLSIVIIVPLVLPMYNAQKAINAACDDPEGKSNAKLGAGNYAWMFVGVIFWVLAIAGTVIKQP